MNGRPLAAQHEPRPDAQHTADELCGHQTKQWRPRLAAEDGFDVLDPAARGHRNFLHDQGGQSGPGGRGGYREFFEKLAPTAAEPILADLAKWETVPEAAREAVIEGIDDFVDGRSMDELEADRDAKLALLLKALYPSGLSGNR